MDLLSVLALIAAIIAIGVSAVAVILVLSVQGLGAEFDESDGPLYALEGSLAGHRTGTPVTAEELVASVTEVIEDDDGEVDTLTCPTTPRTAQGVVTPCHGTIDGVRLAVIVIFDDAAGHYTLLQA